MQPMRENTDMFNYIYPKSFIQQKIPLIGKRYDTNWEKTFAAHVIDTGGAALRWRRTRTGRPLSPPQIHQKNI